MRRVRVGVLVLGLAVGACGVTTEPAPTRVAETEGSIQLNQAPSGYLMGGGGGGTVFIGGTGYRFAIGGLGIYGDEVAVLRTTGQVYGLADIARFSGTYRRLPAGVEPPSGPPGGLWLRNDRGTLIRIAAPPQGRMPDIGLDAVRIVLE